MLWFITVRNFESDKSSDKFYSTDLMGNASNDVISGEESCYMLKEKIDWTLLNLGCIWLKIQEWFPFHGCGWVISFQPHFSMSWVDTPEYLSSIFFCKHWQWQMFEPGFIYFHGIFFPLRVFLHLVLATSWHQYLAEQGYCCCPYMTITISNSFYHKASLSPYLDMFNGE